jgi:APA family basic amino acid/polyamine antiporter
LGFGSRDEERMAGWARRKAIETTVRAEAGRRLKPTLSWPHLVALGVGSVIGTGIYTLTGVGADRAGPGVVLAFAIAGLVCACAALAYAELATLVPAAGSAYTYVYSSLGEVLAWIIGWSMILEYSLGASGVSVGWSAYLVQWLHNLHVDLPPWMLAGPMSGGIINIPAIVVALLITALLAFGVQESATLNIVLVVIKIVALTGFVVLTAPAINPANFHPIMPYGFLSHVENGAQRGVMAAAALVFFAFYGFDAVSTSAEEAKKPARDLTIGLLGSLGLCTLIYMAVSASAVGARPFAEFSKSAAPLALVLRDLHHPQAAVWIAGAALVALPSVILVDMYAQSRIFFVMSRDGLLPRALSKVDPKRGSPVLMTLLTGVFIAAVAGLLPLDQIAQYANSGTLAAFAAVALSMMLLRIQRPDLKRVFKTPLWWLVGPAAIGGCVFLFVSLPVTTMIAFVAWNGVGLLAYFAYGFWNSRVGRGLDAQPEADAA